MKSWNPNARLIVAADRDKSGFIDRHDMAAIAVKLGKEPSEGKSKYIKSIQATSILTDFFN